MSDWPPRCQDCRYFAEGDHGNRQFHECRRNPPAFTATWKQLWPGVQREDWCGEFKKLDRLTPTKRGQ